MIINEQDIRRMVTECVSMILERHGAIDEKLEGLAELIADRIQAGEESFSLTGDEISKYYPYKKHPDELNVTLAGLGLSRPGAYSPQTHTVKISKWVPFCDEKYLLEVLMHELTHWVNFAENISAHGRTSILSDTNKEESVRKILYLFDSTEMQARATQFKYALKRGIDKTEFEFVTHLKLMFSLINAVKSENYEEYKTSYGIDDSFGTIIEGLIGERAYYKYSIDGKDRYTNLLSENEFNKAKAAILRRLCKKYKKFQSSISKIYYDFVSGESESSENSSTYSSTVKNL